MRRPSRVTETERPARPSTVLHADGPLACRSCEPDPLAPRSAAVHAQEGFAHLQPGAFRGRLMSGCKSFKGATGVLVSLLAVLLAACGGVGSSAAPPAAGATLTADYCRRPQRRPPDLAHARRHHRATGQQRSGRHGHADIGRWAGPGRGTGALVERDCCLRRANADRRGGTAGLRCRRTTQRDRAADASDVHARCRRAQWQQPTADVRVQ
jgi:hypothetical protein